jgi:hypothetical protein
MHGPGRPEGREGIYLGEEAAGLMGIVEGHAELTVALPALVENTPVSGAAAS